MTISNSPLVDCLAVDAHGHYGRYLRDPEEPLTHGFMSASAAEVARRASRIGVGTTIVSPLAGLLPRGRADTVAANESAYREVPEVDGLLQYVIVNPLQPETYLQARRMFSAKWCVAIKIHPDEHCYRIADYGDEIFSFASEVGAPLMTHSGCPNSLPDAFVPFANRYREVRLLLAHLGHGGGEGDGLRPDLQVRAVQAARHGNIWVDTSSTRSILPGLIEWAVQEIGDDRLLFGSDTPLYHVAMQRTRIDTAEIKPAAKRMILRENAERFFSLGMLKPAIIKSSDETA